MPVLGRARESGELTRCQNQLRQIGMSVFVYLNETGNQGMRWSFNVAAPSTSQRSWMVLLSKFNGWSANGPFYSDPSDPQPFVAAFGYGTTSYGINRQIGYRDTNPASDKPFVRVDQIRTPSKCAILLDSTDPNIASNTIATFGDSDISGFYVFDPTVNAPTFERHMQMLNVLLMDAHFEAVDDKGTTLNNRTAMNARFKWRPTQ